MRLYFTKDLNKRYSEIIAKYIADGCVINCGTMSGSQGEVAKNHLISADGKKLYNIMMQRHYGWNDNSIKISVSEYDCNTIKRELNNLSSMNTIWNDKGKEIYSESYFIVDRNCKVFADDEMYEVIKAKRNEHLDNKDSFSTYYGRPVIRKTFDPKYNKIVLSWLKRQPKCKSVKLSDIDYINKLIDGNKVSYSVFAKGHCYSMTND